MTTPRAMDFSSCVGSQVKYLVESLSPQNFEDNAEKIEQLLSTFGIEACRFLISYLVQEVCLYQNCAVKAANVQAYASEYTRKSSGSCDRETCEREGKSE